MNNVPFYTFPGSPDPGCYDRFPTFRTGLWSAGNMVFLGRRHFYYPEYYDCTTLYLGGEAVCKLFRNASMRVMTPTLEKCSSTSICR